MSCTGEWLRIGRYRSDQTFAMTFLSATWPTLSILSKTSKRAVTLHTFAPACCIKAGSGREWSLQEGNGEAAFVSVEAMGVHDKGRAVARPLWSSG